MKRIIRIETKSDNRDFRNWIELQLADVVGTHHITEDGTLAVYAVDGKHYFPLINVLQYHIKEGA